MGGHLQVWGGDWGRWVQLVVDPVLSAFRGSEVIVFTFNSVDSDHNNIDVFYIVMLIGYLFTQFQEVVFVSDKLNLKLLLLVVLVVQLY